MSKDIDFWVLLKNFGSKYGKKFLNKGISALKELKMQHLNLIKVNMVKW